MGKGWIRRRVKEEGKRIQEGKLLGRAGRQMDGGIITMRQEERTGRESKERRNRRNDTERWKQMGQDQTDRETIEEDGGRKGMGE